eukprot:6427562-Pyramimonas_sp.AAC.2
MFRSNTATFLLPFRVHNIACHPPIPRAQSCRSDMPLRAHYYAIRQHGGRITTARRVDTTAQRAHYYGAEGGRDSTEDALLRRGGWTRQHRGRITTARRVDATMGLRARAERRVSPGQLLIALNPHHRG